MKTSPLPSTPAPVILRSTASLASGRRGMTLVEVLIAAALFTTISTGFTAAFVQNARMVKTQAYRTHAINTAMAVIEQLRSYGYAELRSTYHAPDTAPPPFVIQLPDPTNTTSTATLPSGYRNFNLYLNQRVDKALPVPNNTWSATNIVLETAADARDMPMRFWLILERDHATTGTLHAVFRITLIYQWQSPGTAGPVWNTGNVKLAVPKLTLDTTNM